MSLTRLWDKIKAPQTVETISFDETGEPIKRPLLRRLFLALVIILVASLSFGLGRLSGGKDNSPIKISFDPAVTALLSPSNEGKPQTASAVEAFKGSVPSISTQENSSQVVPGPRSTGGVVASKNGSKYHFSYCPGAKQIKEANKIYFDTPAAAEASGFTLAANCKLR